MEMKQAIYTSARSATSDGYHLVARSAGITSPDQRLLSQWGPSHDSLVPVDGQAAYSINFFPLSSGASCLSKTFCAGNEHSLRAGARCYTHCLVAGPRYLAAWNNNPFALFQAAEAADLFAAREPIPRDLPNVTLEPIPRSAHAEADSVSPEALHLAEQLRHLGSAACLITGSDDPASLLAQTFELLPVAMRLIWTFSTGLRHSTRRPFRIVCMPRNDRLAHRLARGHGLVVLDCESKNLPTVPSL